MSRDIIGLMWFEETVCELASLHNLYEMVRFCKTSSKGNLNRHVPVVLDYLDDLRSIMVCTDAAEISRRAPAEEVHRIGCVLFLYTDPATNIFDHRPGERITRLEGYRAPVEFYAPDYRKTDMPSATDFRRTLYWNPDVELDADGNATLTFYSNSRPLQRLAVSVQGFSADGHLIELER